MMNRLLRTAAIVLMGFALAVPAGANHARPKGKNKKQAVEAAGEEKKKQSEYEKLFKDEHVTADGMIKLHMMKGKLYFEFPLGLFGRDMLIGSTVTRISDNGDAVVGSKPTQPVHVKFTMENGHVQMRQAGSDYVTDNKDSGIARSLEMSSAGAVLTNAKVAAYSPDSTAVVFEMTDYFVGDNKALTPFDGFSYNTMMLGCVRTESFEKDKSFLTAVKAFPDNVAIQSTLSYKYTLTSTRTKKALAKDVPFTAVVTRSIVLLPEEPYRPRVGDYRMAIFPTAKMMFPENEQGSKTIYYSNRWDLTPSDMAAFRRGDRVEPVKPIVFYIDPNFPESWKPYIKEGVEQWNELFGQVGFENAIRALDFPADDPEFDPDNLKYSCVRYAPVGIQNAMGPSWTDPRSGEIITASVYLYHDVVKLVNNWLFVQTAQTDERVRARNMPEEVVGDALRYVVSHEIGHCLGLMHNMSASAVIPVDSLRSPTFTAQHGTTTSIMDYARFNYVAQPGDFQRGVKLTPPRFGEYDRFSVKWLYTPMPDSSPQEEERVLMEWIREASADPVYRYGRQWFSSPLDPRSQAEDLGDDAVRASEYGISNLKYIMSNIDGWLAGSDDPDYEYLGSLYDDMIMQYVMYMNHVFANVGGIYMQEMKKGDSGEQLRTVPRKVQKEALEFLCSQIGGTGWMDNKAVMSKLGLMGSPSQVVETSIANAIVQAPLKVLNSEGVTEGGYSFRECADDVFGFVWQSALTGRKPSQAEMRMQKTYVQGYVSAAKVTPSEGAAAAAEGQYAIRIPDGVLSGNGTSAEVNPGHIGAVSGYGSSTSKFRYGRNAESKTYGYLLRARDVLRRAAASSSGETRAHYEYLLTYIENSIKVK